MPSSPNKLSHFWQELKRRNVVRVVTVYAGAAFVIIELVNNITEPLRLPEWTPTLVIVLLAIGFPVVIIISWIYDVHPERGMVKTEPSEIFKAEDVPKSSNNWKIASYISFMVIVGLIVLNIIPRSGKKEILEKSIAILPFINESSDQENVYFINGMMESILNNLCKIEDLRVVSRSSIEKYRNEPMPIPIVAEEMNVSYVLEGSGQKVGNRLLLTVQLIVGQEDRHIWSKQYDREIERVEDLFDVQKEIAALVVQEIEAIITPEEKERIERIPTSSATAFDLYQKSFEVSEEESIDLLYYALQYDSTFTEPYIMLGWKYLSRYNFNNDLYTTFLDSANKMVKKALHFDPQSAEALGLRGHLYRQEGKIQEALRSFDRALDINPNLSNAYSGKGWIYFDEMDYVNALENFYQNSIRDRRPAHLGDIYDDMGFILTNAGMKEAALECYDKSLRYTGDTTWTVYRRAQVEFYTGNYQGAIDIALPRYKNLGAKEWSENLRYTYFLALLGESNMIAGKYEDSYNYYRRYVEIADSVGWPMPYHKVNIAFIFNENGQRDRASKLIEIQIRQSEQWFADNKRYNNDHLRRLALAYMLKQDKGNALRYLELLSQQGKANAIDDLIREIPVYGGIKNDPEFVEISNRIHFRYLEEQDRVRQWLEENEML